MSIEFQLAYTCPHEMIREPATLAEDGMTLRTSQTVLGGARVYMNDMEIPPEGLHSPATLVAGISGPYRIHVDATDFTVEYNGMTKEISLTPGVHTAEKLAKEMNDMFAEVEVSVDKGRLHFKDIMQVGAASSIKLSGSAVETTGFDKQRAAHGRMIVPSWGLGMRPGYTTVAYPRFFSRPKQYKNARFEVSYFTEAHRCRRCMATRVENDLRVDNTGRLRLITEENLLYQACLKALLTELGSNLQHKWYGSNIMKLIGTKATAGIASVISDEIKRVLEVQISLQEKQSKYQTVSMKERLYKVLNIKVSQHQKDPTTFMCEIHVQNYSGQPVQLNIVYTVPGANSLIRENGNIVGSMGSY
jgi:phage baseplate assembly protein W